MLDTCVPWTRYIAPSFFVQLWLCPFFALFHPPRPAAAAMATASAWLNPRVGLVTFPPRCSCCCPGKQLVLYGLYKQASFGDCRTQRPGLFDPTGRAKWWGRGGFRLLPLLASLHLCVKRPPCCHHPSGCRAVVLSCHGPKNHSCCGVTWAVVAALVLLCPLIVWYAFFCNGGALWRFYFRVSGVGSSIYCVY